MYERQTKVRFAHCDAAGLMFYPSTLLLINEMVEDWFSDELGAAFGLLHSEWGCGVPTVDLKAHFVIPCRLGDVLKQRLEVGRVGRSSCGLEHTLMREEHVALRCDQTIVFTDLETMTAKEWPAGLRERMLLQQKASIL